MKYTLLERFFIWLCYWAALLDVLSGIITFGFWSSSLEMHMTGKLMTLLEKRLLTVL